jgi:tRNA1(Val) A37 N6-methylase TrmN6
MKSNLAELALKAVVSSEFDEFDLALQSPILTRSFGILSDSELARTIASQMGSADPTNWVIRPLTWNAELYSPSAQLKPAERLLHLLWQDLHAKLVRKLESVNRRTNLAPKGMILCFFGRADFCIVVEYRKSSRGAISLRPLAVRHQPTGLFELSSLFGGANAEVRNDIKNVALSVDKLVFQRDAIIHVDRQKEDVFGPTIDTVLLAELIAEWLDEQPLNSKITALEIGSGSGLLTTVLALSDHVRDLTTIDLNPSAAFCTLKNLQVNELTLDAIHQVIRVRAERYAADQFPAPFDFIACNPPYIPHAPTTGSLSQKEYERAVGGVELCVEILGNLPKLLAPHGRLLLMTSSLSNKEIVSAIPAGFEWFPALSSSGRRVPLEVDAVWRMPIWRGQLLEDGRIEQDSEGSLWHQLHPLWIKHCDGRS